MPGPQVSEILALQWPDINLGELTMRVTCGVVDRVVDEVKTGYSEDDLPLDPDLATVLLSWKERCPESEEGWMFPSPITGRCYHASPIQQDYIRPAGRKFGLGDIGWHTFRHTYRSWLGWHFDGSAAETDTARSDCNHHERLWRRHDGIEARSQQQGRTDGTSAGTQRGKMKKAAEAADYAPFCPCGKK